MIDATSRLRAVLDRETDDTLAGVALTVISAIVFIWGVLAVIDAYRRYGRPDLPRWHPRRWVAPCYGFFLGLFLILADGVIYGAIAFNILSTPESLPLGWAVYLSACGVLAAVAFGYWSRERVSRWGGR